MDARGRGANLDFESRELTAEQRHELVRLLAERGWFGAVGAAALSTQPGYRAPRGRASLGEPISSQVSSEGITHRPRWSVRDAPRAGAARR